MDPKDRWGFDPEHIAALPWERFEAAVEGVDWPDFEDVPGGPEGFLEGLLEHVDSARRKQVVQARLNRLDVDFENHVEENLNLARIMTDEQLDRAERKETERDHPRKTILAAINRRRKELEEGEPDKRRNERNLPPWISTETRK